ncbi:MAG: PDZ domain-containing protein [Deinococcales bacterium]
MGEVVGVISYISFIPESLRESQPFIPEPLKALLLPSPYTAYAIPVEAQSDLLKELLAGGHRDVPALGISFLNDDMLNLTGFRHSHGIPIDIVYPASPAQQAGLQSCHLKLGNRRLPESCAHYVKRLEVLPGSLAESYQNFLENYQVEADVITAINGKEVRNANDLISILRSYEVGDKVILSIQRGQESLESSIQLAAKSELF